MSPKNLIVVTAVAAAACAAIVFAATTADEPLARITAINGDASILRMGAADWKPTRPNMSLALGDQIVTRAESFVEIRYAVGTVLRMNENTKIALQSASGDSIRTENMLGNVWVNMKKLTKKGKVFDVSTPTAVASVRGTVFKMDALPDSATYVSVFDGKVAVGPTDSLKKKIETTKTAKSMGVTEVSGPTEVPGPFEVSLEAWKVIIAGQKISVRADGKFSQEKFDMKKADSDAFVKKNQELDKKMMAE